MRILHHGSHPEHGFELLPAAPVRRQCSVCKALSDGSDVRWFGCIDGSCDILLCEKCFNVKEMLMDEPQVMIRNPMLDYDDADATLRTRPRPNSYCLSMLYGGRLLRVVSSAAGTEDPSEVYFRIASGGWIKKSHVVCVHPHDSPRMQLLTEVHLSNRKLGADIASGAVQFDVLRNLLYDCMATLDDNEGYGIVMSALVMFPLLSTVELPLSSFRVAPDPMPIVEYVYFILHFVVNKLVERMNEEMRQFEFRLADSTMAPLFGDVLARALYAAVCLACNWRVRLPSSYAYLVSQALATMERLRLLLREEPLDQPPAMCISAVAQSHTTALAEKQRLCRLMLYVTDMGGRLLQQCIRDVRVNLDVLQPMRDQLCGGCSQGLSKVFCESLACMAEVDLVQVQRNFLQLDALEVIGSLAVSATLAESQAAVFHVVQLLARENPQNIAVLSAVLLQSLLETVVRTQSPAVYVEAMECFNELAFNDPRLRGEDGAEAVQPVTRCCTALTSPLTKNSSTPFQLLSLFRLSSGVFMSLCVCCAAAHPPIGASLVGRPQYGHGVCSCPHCASGTVAAADMAPLPSVPATAALRVLEGQLPAKALVLAEHMQIPQALNALGRMLLRVAAPEELLLRIMEELVRYPSLEQVPYAALAIRANAHLGQVRQRLACCGETELARYVLGAMDLVTPSKNYVDQTPSKSHQHSELGLSASPYASSALQSGSLYNVRGGLSSCPRDSTRAIQLFGPGASTEE